MKTSNYERAGAGCLNSLICGFSGTIVGFIGGCIAVNLMPRSAELAWVFYPTFLLGAIGFASGLWSGIREGGAPGDDSDPWL